MLATGCPDDGGTASGTETEGEESSTSDSDTTPSTTQTETTVSSTMTDPTTTDTLTTTDPDSSSSEGDCTGECTIDDDCAPGQTCIACLCVGEPVGCKEWGEGEFANCIVEGGFDETVCGGTGAFCLNAASDIAACSFPCMETCDCPAPPAGFEAQVTCMDVTADMMGDCYIACGGGDGCPDGMFCYQGTACLFGEEPAGIPPYGDCVNMEGTCESGLCLVDDVMMPSLGWCGPACTGDDDCPAPPSGDAPAACVDISGMGDLYCQLDCSNDATCPDGMVCLAGPDICIWEFVPPPEVGYGDCANSDPEDACLETETCLDDASGSVCTSTCTMASDCPDAPETGDAPVTCGDLGGGDTCYLDCSGGQTCPDNMECLDDNYCHFVALAFILDEDFEGGDLPAGWTVVDVDGNTPADETSFVDAAWVVTDAFEEGMNFAAYSTSWYAPAGQADDWLVTPQLMVSATSQLRWEGWAVDANFADGYEVRISTTGDQPDDFMVEAALFTIDDRAQAFTFHSVDLSAYAGEMVYIAFRNNSDDENLLVIDNVQVSE